MTDSWYGNSIVWQLIWYRIVWYDWQLIWQQYCMTVEMKTVEMKPYCVIWLTVECLNVFSIHAARDTAIRKLLKGDLVKSDKNSQFIAFRRLVKLLLCCSWQVSKLPQYYSWQLSKLLQYCSWQVSKLSQYFSRQMSKLLQYYSWQVSTLPQYYSRP